MTAPITTSGARSGLGGATTQLNRTGQMDQEKFLTLLVAQLKNQDPLSPLQPHEFAAQLAQFSSLEQLVQVNDALSQQMAAVEIGLSSSQASLGASLLGREVLAESTALSVDSSGRATLSVEAGTGGGSVALRLLDANGRLVATRDLGPVPGGVTDLSVEGLPPGSYTIDLRITNDGGSPVPGRALARGRVDRVSFDNGIPVLHVGNLEVTLAQLIEIKPGAAGAAALRALPVYYPSGVDHS